MIQILIPDRGQMWCRTARLSPPGLAFTNSAEDGEEYREDAARSRKTIFCLGMLHFSRTVTKVKILWEENIRKTDIGNTF